MPVPEGEGRPGGKVHQTIKAIAYHRPAGSVRQELNHFSHISQCLCSLFREMSLALPGAHSVLGGCPPCGSHIFKFPSFFVLRLFLFRAICYCLMDAIASQIPPRKLIFVSSCRCWDPSPSLGGFSCTVSNPRLPSWGLECERKETYTSSWWSRFLRKWV